MRGIGRLTDTIVSTMPRTSFWHVFHLVLAGYDEDVAVVPSRVSRVEVHLVCQAARSSGDTKNVLPADSVSCFSDYKLGTPLSIDLSLPHFGRTSERC